MAEVPGAQGEQGRWAGCECPGCGRWLLEDLHDAGSCFYVGQVCDQCGEVGWLLGIYATRAEAEAALAALSLARDEGQSPQSREEVR